MDRPKAAGGPPEQIERPALPDDEERERDQDGSWWGVFEILDALVWVGRGIWTLIAWAATLTVE